MTATALKQLVLPRVSFGRHLFPARPADGVTAVSATVLNYKAELFDPAETVQKKSLQDKRLPIFARVQLEDLLKSIKESRSRRNTEGDLRMEPGLYERLAVSSW